MKKIGLLFLLVFAISLAGKAQTATNETAPVMSFEKTVHDYGTIKKGSEGSYDFVFTNTGKEPLILSKPRSNCGCTVPDWPQEPIMPGQSNKIKVTYNTALVGPINKQVTIISNASNSPIVLQIKGAVVE
jgi:hypothetical protein